MVQSSLRKISEERFARMFDTLQFVVNVRHGQHPRKLARSFLLPLLNPDDKLKCIGHALPEFVNIT